MRRTSWLFALLVALPLIAGDVAPIVSEGVALYDAGKYDEAVARFKAALAEDPASDLAAYELGLTYQAKNDPASCIALLEPRVKKKSDRQPGMLSILGNCYDIGGQPDKAIAAYRRGLRIDPKDDQLLFNLAVTLTGRGELDEARALLKKELIARPDHPSGHYALASVFAAQNFRAAAVLEYLRFLALEPTTPRAKEASTRLLALIGAGVEVKDEKTINITIDTSSRKEEGDYSGFEMTMALVGAAPVSDDDKAKVSEFEKARKKVGLVLAILTEAPPKGARDYTATQNVPFFRELAQEKLLDALAGVSVLSLGLEGAETWQNENEGALLHFVAFMRSR